MRWMTSHGLTCRECLHVLHDPFTASLMLLGLPPCAAWSQIACTNLASTSTCAPTTLCCAATPTGWPRQVRQGKERPACAQLADTFSCMVNSRWPCPQGMARFLWHAVTTACIPRATLSAAPLNWPPPLGTMMPCSRQLHRARQAAPVLHGTHHPHPGRQAAHGGWGLGRPPHPDRHLCVHRQV